MNTKYVAYIRVSTEKQGRSGLGLEGQRAIIKNYVPEKDIVMWFEEHKSGKNLDVLPRLNKAIEYVKTHKDHVLVLAKTDRLRNTQQALDIIDELTPKKVFFCNIGRDADKFILTIFFAFAEKERLEISIRTKAALAVLKARGVKLGRPWHKVQNIERHREISKLGSEARRRQSLENPRNKIAYAIAAEMRKRGETYDEIAKCLNSLGHITPRGVSWVGSSVYKTVKRYDGFIINMIDETPQKI